MNEQVEYLDLDDLVTLAELLLGSPAPVRDIGLLGSAAARPMASAFGADAYPDVWTKASALLQSIVCNHALVDGNKRLGWLATATFLSINGVDPTHATNDDVYELVIWVASSPTDVGAITVRLRSIIAGHTHEEAPP